MEAALGLQSNGGNESKSKAEAVEPAESELELGLSLSLCGGGGGGGGVLKSNQNQPCGWGDYGRILTAKDFPSLLSHGGSSSSSDNNNNNNASVVAVSGSKRSANYSVAHEIGSATANSQAVGWPPIGAYRMNSLVSQAKVPSNEEKAIGENDKPKDSSKKKVYNGSNKNDSSVKEKGHLGFVKVNTDGLPIGRKVDLNAHSCYETLAQALEEMFFRSSPTLNRIRLGGERDQAARPSKLLDTSSEFVLTYEDKEGDWMLVGDVPWRMFLSTVKRLRIMRTSEANGLALRFQERRNLPGNKPI